MKKWLPWVITACFAAWFISGVKAPEPVNGFDVAAWGRLPVLLDGRIQPLDSVARNSLLSMSGTSEVNTTNGTLTATSWLLETMTDPDVADERQVFRVQHTDLSGMLGATTSGLTTFSFHQLSGHFTELENEVQKLRDSEEGKGDDVEKLRNPYQKDLVHLVGSIQLYNRLKSSLEPEGTEDFQKELADYQQAIVTARAAVQNADAGKPPGDQDLAHISYFIQRYTELTRVAYPLMVPPMRDEPRSAWANVGTNLMDSISTGTISPPVKFFADMSTAFRNEEPQAFNEAVAGYRHWLDDNGLASAVSKGNQEFFFNQIQPFYVSMVIYVAAVILGCAYWINLSTTMRQSGFYLLVLGFVIHTFALIYRMHLQGRPPVTNLYSSAIFIGWAAVIFGIFLERIFKGGIGVVCAGLIGFVTLNIAHHLALSGDTMEMLQAVLDTNLWLSTHVVVVTLGYASMFVAGLLAIIYILRGFFTRSLTPELGKTLARMVYGIVCFATLFSFVGTILGGIWADQSWGRFWGWDPKENGALLIVLWNAIILHARWGGMVRERGLMVLAVFGNIVTSFSWFGVNMLGIGLHSYGFMDKAFYWLMFFDATQVVLIALALSPSRYWASFKSSLPPASPAPTVHIPSPSLN